ncbi:MAG: autotransporter-associated beta strand repeat-containing protein [Planctomycetaceae bacterium]|jgi:autotransporter-associated beta strand protein/predicted outer membrane repeat protein|nr:autotransporter-associated beta strand repeat-containing protein [Planctomycetaceae bacterium]
MSCNSVRLLATTLVFTVILCAVALAQTPVTYHIWNTENLPNSSATEKYYRYLSRPADAPNNQPGLYQAVPYFYDYNSYYYYGTGGLFNIVLHNDDATLSGQPFYLELGAAMTIESDNPGVARTIRVTDTPLFYIYNSQLTLSNDLIISKTDNGSGAYGYGAIYLAGGILNAENTLFQSNINSSGYGGAITANYYENDYYNRNIANVSGARFEGNQAYYGGAIYLNQSDLFGDKVEFRGNSTNDYYGYASPFYHGGAIYLANRSNARLENSLFENNTAIGNGGAIYSTNSNLYLKGTNFRQNNASGKGGAIFFDVNDGGDYTIQLGAFQGTSVEFAGNKQDYDSTNGTGNPNSIAFGTSSATGTARVLVDVEGAGNHFSLRDPMEVPIEATGGNLNLVFTKTGDGNWNLYGNSDLSRAAGVLFNIERGTFRLGNDARLNLVTGLELDQFNVRNNAVLVIGDQAGTENPVNLATHHFQIDGTLQLDQTLNLDVRGNENVINGTLTGTGDLIKSKSGNQEEGTLKFSGKTENYSGNLQIQSGTFWADSASSFETTGSVNFGKDTVLSVTANSKESNIVAKNISIGDDVTVKINGVIGGTQEFCILDSENVIDGDFSNTQNQSLEVDYLEATFGFSDDRKQYKGTVTLTWDADDVSVSNGTFTIDPLGGQTDYFKVDTELKDTTSSGKKLTKKGLGTLELARANEYRGGTEVESGTLLLTHAQGTGTAPVNVHSGAILALNFNGDYNQQISGAGKVTKTGSNTVTLTNTSNNYSGGTRIEGGTLVIGNDKVFGTGDLIFAGGTLQTKSSSSNETITISKQNITAEVGNDIRFDTETDLTIARGSTLAGDGGIVKTGKGKLTLAGSAAYHGTTHIKEGTLSLASVNAIGLGKVILDDGITFENTAALTNDRNIILNAADNSGSMIYETQNDGVIFDVQNDWDQTGSIDGEGMLVKTGTGTLTFSGNNSYSGGTRLKAGILEFSTSQNFGGGQLIFEGGTLRNLQAIDDFSLPMTAENGSSFLLDTPHDLTISSRLNGSGGLTKSGTGTLTLTGSNDYWGATSVQSGVLKVDGELTRSKVTVHSGAVLTGSGIIDNNVELKSGSVYQWNFGIREEDSPYLNVRGKVQLSDTIFRPVTAVAAQEHYPDVIDDWTVLRYGMLEGEFASIDNTLSPFYDFTFDYSTPNRIKVIGTHRRDPRPLSDSVAMGITMAQRKVSRRAFEQIDNELQNGRYLGLRPIRIRKDQTRGQTSSSARHAWGNFYGRTTEFESSYHTNDPWRLNSFGLQVGYSFLSANWLSFGITAGVEIPQLKNNRDKIDASDGYIGLYFGKRIYGLWELKAYLGGGTQNYTSYRNDTQYTYRSKYRGDSFETNFELGRPILFGTYLVRPHFGFDLEYAGQQGSVESKPSNEYRTYSNASLTQLYFRVGIDVEKRLALGDLFLGIDYANMIGGESLPSVKVYYPTVKSGTTVYGTTLGQNIVSIRGGGNYYLNAIRSKSLFMNITGDIFADRAEGKAGVTATFGYDCRF